MAKRSVAKQRRLADRFNTDDANRIHSAKDFAGKASMDLTDEEIRQAAQVINECRLRYRAKRNTVENLEALRDEVLTRLADISILATFDPTPCYYGEPPEVEIVGKINTDPIHKEGFDYERKIHEVREANKRNEDYRGQKEKA